jgi:hypothetical protein
MTTYFLVEKQNTGTIHIFENSLSDLNISASTSMCKEIRDIHFHQDYRSKEMTKDEVLNEIPVLKNRLCGVCLSHFIKSAN